MKYLRLIVILAAMVVGFFAGKSCQRPTTIVNEIVQIDTVRVIDSVAYPVIEKVPVPYKVIERDTIFITEFTDTTAIHNLYKDYFLTRLYREMALDDDNGRIKVKMTVTENKLVNFIIEEFTLYNKVEYVTNTVDNTVAPKYRLLVGVGVGYDPLHNELPLAGKIKFQDKKNRIYGYSYNPFSKIHELEASFPVLVW
jgi:hypothetical protein